MIENKTSDIIYPELTDLTVIEVFLKRVLGTCLNCNEELVIEDSYSYNKETDSRNPDFTVKCNNCNTQMKFEI